MLRSIRQDPPIWDGSGSKPVLVHSPFPRPQTQSGGRALADVGRVRERERGRDMWHLKRAMKKRRNPNHISHALKHPDGSSSNTSSSGASRLCSIWGRDIFIFDHQPAGHCIAYLPPSLSSAYPRSKLRHITQLTPTRVLEGAVGFRTRDGGRGGKKTQEKKGTPCRH